MSSIQSKLSDKVGRGTREPFVQGLNVICHVFSSKHKNLKKQRVKTSFLKKSKKIKITKIHIRKK